MPKWVAWDWEEGNRTADYRRSNLCSQYRTDGGGKGEGGQENGVGLGREKPHHWWWMCLSTGNLMRGVCRVGGGRQK